MVWTSRPSKATRPFKAFLAACFCSSVRLSEVALVVLLLVLFSGLLQEEMMVIVVIKTAIKIILLLIFVDLH
jgi:hypothetical protein